MELLHDRKIIISVGSNRKALHWNPQEISLSELWEKLKNPTKGTETQADYFALKKNQQDELKDVGGFVGGTLNGERRKASAVTGRDLITLDFDTIKAYGTEDVIAAVEKIGVSYCIYSTRKHLVTAPRLRIIFPLDRTVSVDEYEPIARRLAQRVGIEMTDPTTFEPSRLMYWPSCSADGKYVYTYADKPLVCADNMLQSYTIEGKDWHDVTAWPQVPGTSYENTYKKLATKQGDPETKDGIVGAFCRVYDVLRAMDELVPGIYAPVDNDPNRYTYLGGSTAGGAVIYDNGKFLFSHHATDPCSGRLVNAFDLVRLHRFGDMDDEAKDGTPTNRMPSYNAMCELAASDTKVAALLAKERHDEAVKEFEGISSNNNDAPENWMQKLKINPRTGVPLSTINNVVIILGNDPNLKNKFALNEFAGRGEVLALLPWETPTEDEKTEYRRRLWSDTDTNNLYCYMEELYGITKRNVIDSALDIHSTKNKFNLVQDYIKALEWDGTPRLDTLFIDYLGAEDDAYTRAVCRKSFTAAVARAMVPGCKFDNMLILCGRQGLGKSTLLDKMSRGWFNDSIRTFEGKEASELLPGVWIVEVAELDAFRKTDVSRIKQFLSLRADRYRAAYGRNMSEFPRRCVFFGTCNQMEFLQDTTGNRRFWPVDVGINNPAKRVWKDLTDEVIDQIWAEAKMRWQIGENLFLSGDIEQAANDRQEAHRDVSPREGKIIDFVNCKVPADWSTWTLDRRRDFWALEAHGNYQLVERERICPIEVWCELFNGSMTNYKAADIAEIRAVITSMQGWQRTRNPLHFGKSYGSQRGFVRRI